MGFESLHVSSLDLESTADAVIWARAANEGRVVVTKDEDFCHLARRPGENGRVVWVRLGNRKASELTITLIRAWLGVVERLRAGQRIIEIR